MPIRIRMMDSLRQPMSRIFLAALFVASSVPDMGWAAAAAASSSSSPAAQCKSNAQKGLDDANTLYGSAGAGNSLVSGAQGAATGGASVAYGAGSAAEAAGQSTTQNNTAVAGQLSQAAQKCQDNCTKLGQQSKSTYCPGKPTAQQADCTKTESQLLKSGEDLCSNIGDLAKRAAGEVKQAADFTQSSGQTKTAASDGGSTGSATPSSSGGSSGGGSLLSGLGGGGMMSGLMMAGVGAMAGYMYEKNQAASSSSSSDDSDSILESELAADAAASSSAASSVSANGYASPDGVVQSTGQLDCTKDLAYRYTACDSTVASACAANITTMETSQICSQFGARYCNTGGYVVPQIYSAYPYPLYVGEVIGNQIVTQASPTYETDVAGRGSGSSYCLKVLQINFCQSASNTQCPSCQQLANLNSTSCVANPALCQVQSSATVVQSQLAACPATDPLISVPGSIVAQVAAASTTTSTATTTSTSGTTVSTATATASPATTSTTVAASTTTPSATSTTGSTTSTSTSTSVPTVTAPTTTPAATSTAGIDTGTGVSFVSVSSVTPASVAGTSRTVASNTTTETTPVGNELGPSLFSNASSPVTELCNSGKLNNCLR